MISLIVALGAGVLVYILFVMFVPKAVPDETGERLRDALDRLQEENRSAVIEQQDVMRGTLMEESAFMRFLFGLPVFSPLYNVAVQAGYQDNLDALLMRMGIYFLILLGGAFYLHLGILLAPVAVVAAYMLTYRHCQRVLARRNLKFIDQFPDALDVIVRSVRSGFPLAVALQMLAESAQEPIRSQFQQVVEEIALGRTLHQALSRLASRINEPDVRFFVVVIGVQQETGGNLAEIISNLSGIIRKRKQLRHKIRAMTSEGKATGWVLGSLPCVVFLMLYIVQPEYLHPFFVDPLGQKLLGSVVGLLAICFLVVREMIKVDI